MRKYLLIFILFVLPWPVLAGDNTGLGFGLGFRSGIPKNKTYDQYKDSYNQFYASTLKTPFKGLGMGAGYGIHADATFNGFVMSMRYSRYYASDRAELQSGNIREMRFSQTFLAMGMGAGLQKQKGYFQVTVNALFGNEMIKSATVYPGGNKSYGLDKALNGVFDGIRLGGSLNMEMGYRIFFLSAEYIVGNDKNYMSDSNGQRMDLEHPGGIPTDVGRWFNSPSAYDYGQEDFVRPVTNGIRFEIGLRLNISDNE